MDDAFLAPPLPARPPARGHAHSRRAAARLLAGCSVRFPIKQGLPVLVPDEGELPESASANVSQLPCRRAPDRVSDDCC